MLPWPIDSALKPGLKAILFDLDNTLFDRDGAFETCLLQEFTDPQVRQDLRRLDGSGLGPRQELFTAWSKASDQPMNQDIFVQKILQAAKPELRLIQALEILARDYKLGLITNGGKASQWSKIRAMRLDGVFPFERVWISGEVGLEKPDPKIFLLACAALGERPEDCLYIGDRDEIDGLGANKAGLQYLSCVTQ